MSDQSVVVEVPVRADTGPLGWCVDAFAAQLQHQGYAATTAQEQLRVVTAFSACLGQRGVALATVAETDIEAFLGQAPRHGRRRRLDRALLGRLLAQWRACGLVTTHAPRREEDARPIERAFATYLRAERGLTPSTSTALLRVVHHFLAERAGPDPGGVAAVQPSDITAFVLQHAHAQSPAGARQLVGALRSFLRFLYLRGVIATDLTLCVPTVAAWRGAAVPPTLSPDELARLLRTCPRARARDRRDYAMLLLLARLGLRAGEVAALTLDDVEWHAGELTVHGKGPRQARLPLPQDVGAAVVAYLRHGRPQAASRRLFLRAHAPHHGISRVVVSTCVARALARAGLTPARTGAHLLRHTLATQMLRRGASLAAIGEVLRHRHLDTTAVYAKVDLIALRRLALRWPGGAR